MQINSQVNNASLFRAQLSSLVSAQPDSAQQHQHHPLGPPHPAGHAHLTSPATTSRQHGTLEAVSSPSLTVPPPQGHRAIMATTLTVLQLGARVAVAAGEGTVRFVGQTSFAPGKWVGVELDEANGKNDGSVAGSRYFSTAPLRGMFVKPGQVRLLEDGDLVEEVVSPQSVRDAGPVLTSANFSHRHRQERRQLHRLVHSQPRDLRLGRLDLPH